MKKRSCSTYVEGNGSMELITEVDDGKERCFWLGFILRESRTKQD
jgi:hypothetical protein